MPLDISKEITLVQQVPVFGQYLARALSSIQTGLNNIGQNLAVDPTGTLPAPPPVNQLQVKTNGTGMVHAVITDNSAIQKHLNYFIEYDTSPSFPQPHVAHLGASRTMSPIMLPALDDAGKPQSFYFRAYSQYHGGNPGPAIAFGGNVPTAVNPGGTQQLTLLPSTGSGTAQATGQQGGQGFGVNLFRPSSANLGQKRLSK